MSFLPAVQREINNRRPNDPARVVLQLMLVRGVGRNNAITLPDILAHLQTHGMTFTGPQFQQTVLAASRGADYFIGSGRRGYYLIDAIGDAEEMRDFYEARICHRSLQNQPLGVESKPATPRCFIHISFLKAGKRITHPLLKWTSQTGRVARIIDH